MDSAWFTILPTFLRRRLEGRDELQKIINNIVWLFLDKLLRMGVGLFVGVWIARYLAPVQFGAYNYALAFVTLFAAFASLGLDGIVVRDISCDPSSRDMILGTAFILKLCSGVVTLVLAVVIVCLIRPGDLLTQWLVAIITAGTIFQAFDVIDFWFQSQVQSKYTVYAKNGSFLLFTFIKICLILLKQPLISFAWVAFAETVVGAAALVLVYRKIGKKISSWSVSISTAKRLLHESWPLMFAYLSCIVYMRIDQVMIGSMLDNRAVGIYSAATRIFEIPLSLILLVSGTIYPIITELYVKDRQMFWARYYQATYYYTISSVILLIGAYFLGHWSVELIFGKSYAEATNILLIQLLGLVFMANAGLRSSYLTISSNQRIIMVTTFFSAIANIVMNYFLIPVFHVAGAAFASVITQMLSLLILNICFRETRVIFWVQLKALCLLPYKSIGPGKAYQ